MRCRTCDYPLWNVKARNCPDCGAEFKPSEHVFPRGGVRFLCPHCDMAYYGTGEKGHLQPSSFTCVGCSTPITMDAMVVAPLEGETADTQVHPNPWLGRTSLVKPYLSTLRDVLLHPADFARSIPYAAPLGDAALFFAIGTVGAFLVNLSVQGCLFGVGAVIFRQMAPGNPNPFATVGMGSRVMQSIVFGLVFSVLWVIVESLLAHLLLRGAAKSDRIGRITLGRGMHAYLYGGGAGAALMCLQAIPCCGGMIGVAWFGLSIYVIGMLLRETYGVSTARAIWTMIGVRVVSSVLLGLAIIGYVLIDPRSFGLPPALIQRLLSGQMNQPVGQQFAAYRTQNGVWPTSPIQPFLNDSFGLMELVELTRTSGPATIGQLNGGTIMTDDGTLAAAEHAALAARLTPTGSNGAAPFRLGGACFVYPIAGPEPDAWLVIVDRKGNAGFVRVITPTRELLLPTGDFAGELSTENMRRVAAGQPPIPDPTTVPDLLNAPTPSESAPPPAPVVQPPSVTPPVAPVVPQAPPPTATP